MAANISEEYVLPLSLVMEAAASVSTYQIKHNVISQKTIIHFYCCGNLKSHVLS
jgi:hypothetical protein